MEARTTTRDAGVGPDRRPASARKLAVLVAALVVAVVACGATDGSVEGEENPGSSPTTIDTASTTVATPVPVEAPSALESMTDPTFPPSLVDVSQIISGGPPPDGIPPIDNPTFLSVAGNQDVLPGSEAVVGLAIDGDARAYPIRAMVWHEIVNDVVGGIPVSVTYCPLCNSAATYGRTIDGTVTTFGTSGRLYASALVMYDRATESLWTHFDGRAVVGALAGAKLVSYPSPLLSWDEFVASYPDGSVLDWRAAGFDRDYGRNPYSGYDTPDNEPFLFRGALDDRAAAMQRVVGIGDGTDAIAFTDAVIRGGEARVTAVGDGSEAVIFWVAGQVSALEGGTVGGGRDVGSVGVFVPELGGGELSFEVRDGEIIDVGTGSVWSVTGRAISGPLEGEQLVGVPHLFTFWFAWSTYQPSTTLIDF